MIIIETTTRERLVLADFAVEKARAEKAERAAAEWAAEVDALRAEALAELADARRERDTLLAELSDAKAECRGALLSAHTQYAETVRERDEARAELARLRPDGVDEPLDVELGGVFAQAKRDNETGPHVVSPLRVVYRLGVAHERARFAAAGVTVARPEDAALFEEELERVYSNAYAKAWGSELSTPDRGERAGLLAVAARVRQERCLVAQAVSAGLRHARAMKAVLLAAKAWARRWPRDRTLDEQRAYEVATARLLSAQARLAKIEKEVSRG